MVRAYLVTQDANLLESTGEDSCDVYAGTVYLPHEGIKLSDYSASGGASGNLERIHAGSGLGDNIMIGDLCRGNIPSALHGKIKEIDIPDSQVRVIDALLRERETLEKTIRQQAGIVLSDIVAKS